MTHAPTDHPLDADEAGRAMPPAPPPHGSPASPDGGAQPPRRRARLWWRILLGLLLIVVLAGAALFVAGRSAAGTRLLWNTAVRFSGGHLSGRYAGGTIARGVKLEHVQWRAGGDLIQADFISAQWVLTRAPWRFTADFLHLGTLDIALAPAAAQASAPVRLPDNLSLPLQLDIRSLRVDHLRWHAGTQVTQLDDISLSARSDGYRHRLALDSVQSGFGSVSGSLTLDGVRPFKVSGAIGYAGHWSHDPVNVSARLGGSLEQMSVDIDASGKQLQGQAHLEAMPFGPVLFKYLTVQADHVDLRAFAPGAPAADLSLRARLAPLPAPGAAAGADAASAVAASGDAASASASSASAASASASSGAAARSGAAAGSPTGLVVGGQVTITNAHPGALTAQLLPLIDARATVQLDAHHQTVQGLQVRLAQGGTVTGAGQLKDGLGGFDLAVAGLDAHLLAERVRPTHLAGTLKVALRQNSELVTLDLADPKAAVRLQGGVRLEAAQTTFENVRVTAGAGHLDASGSLKQDERSTYALKTTLTDFNPLLLLDASSAAAPPRMPARGAMAHATAPGRRAAAPGTVAPVTARINATLDASGTLSPQPALKATLNLRESTYDGLPLTGGGTVQLAGQRLLPSRLALSVAGNQLNLEGSFGTAADRLAFHIDAPAIEHLGFGLAGTVHADGTVRGSLTHPDMAATYSADALVFGNYRAGHAQGRAELRDGANGALALTLDASAVSAPGVALSSLSANLAGTRASHTLSAHAAGTVNDRKVDFNLAARGKLTDRNGASSWDGTITELANQGFAAVQLAAPVSLSASSGRIEVGAANLTLEGASLSLQKFVFDHGRVQTAGSLHGIDIDRWMRLSQAFAGPSRPVRTDLVIDGDWNINIADTATGYVQLTRRSGDITLSTWRGAAAMGVSQLQARADFAAGNRVELKLSGKADRIGTIGADLHSQLSMRDGALTLADDAPLNGTLTGDVPQLRTTGGLFGPTYVLDGKLQLQLQVAGEVARPKLSGQLDGNGLAATLIDQGIQFKQGVVHIVLNNNLVQFQQVEFHGESGTLRATGQIQLDEANPGLAVQVVADKLELFASPDRQLQLSGQASVRNEGAGGGIAIDGKFGVEHALFDLPESAAPALGSDVHIITQDGSEQLAKKPALPASQKPAGTFAPHANIAIDLGNNFRFRGAGADLRLAGSLLATSKPGEPLRAVGNVTVVQGSTYSAFGRKLDIDNGYFTFNGPIDNPGINILAMRHNQEVEAGVQVSGTLQVPVARLTSEPNVPDNEKLSWLLFGHGTDQGSTVGQQSTVSQAFALLGSAGGKRVAKTLGVDEVTVGQSEVGMTDPQVVLISKAISERIVLGYEQGLTSAASVFKATLNLSRFWAISVHTGALNGATLLFNRRFD